MEKNKRTLQSDEYFCSSCGEMIKKAAEICPKCGVRMKSKESSKSKTIAVLLAFFLGMWTWVYTWKTDQYKFATVCFLGVIAWIFWVNKELIKERREDSNNSKKDKLN